MGGFFHKFIILITVLLIIVFVAVFLVMVLAAVTNYSPEDVEELEVYGNGNKGRPNTDELSFMTWNIGYCGLGREMNFFYDDGRMVRPDKQQHLKYQKGIQNYLQEQDTIDFICFQEVDVHSKRSYFSDQWQLFLQNLEDHYGTFAFNYDVRFVPMPVWEPMGRVKSGLSTFSRYEPENAERYAFKGNYRWPMRWFMLDRCFIKSVFPLENGRKLVLLNTHNSAFDDGSLRQEQLQVLRTVMISEYEKGNFVVTCGDWNMNPPGFLAWKIHNGDMVKTILPTIEKDYLPKGWKWAFDPKIPTNRELMESYLKTRTVTTIIDFFVLSPNIELLEVHAGDLGFEDSDHNPVFLKVRLRD